MRKMLIPAALVAALSANAAQAANNNGSSTSVMAVTAAVAESCTVVAGPMTFGTVSPGTPVDAAATLSLTCTPNADYDILLNGGNNSSSGQRRLANVGGTEFLPYNLYIDASRTQPWGNTVGTDTKAGTVGLTGVTTHQVYGQIPASATPVSAGAYSDVVTVTVNF